jgi:sec-independent protein translocase protein TatB
MFGMSGTELIIILILALLLLGPDKLPEMAKLAGKTMREFQKATDDVRGTVERELRKLEHEADVATTVAVPPPVIDLKTAPPQLPSRPIEGPTAVMASSDMDLTAKVIPLDRRPAKDEAPT